MTRFMAFSRLIDKSSDCGSSNGASQLMKQLNKDRSLQKDHYFHQSNESLHSGFRTPRISSPVVSSDNLVHEFFKQNESRPASPASVHSFFQPSPVHSPFPHSPIHSPIQIHSPSPVNSPLRVQSPAPDNWIHEFQEKNRISSPLAPSTHKEFEEIYNRHTPTTQWETQFLSQNAQEEQLAFDRALEQNWHKAFEQIEQQTYEYTPNNPYIQQPEFIPHAINTTPSDTIMALEAKSQIDPTDAQTWHELGVKQQENERDTAAISALEKAVSIDPSCLDAWLALSISYTNEHRRKDAYRALHEWIAHHPKYKHIHPRDDHASLLNAFLEAARVCPGHAEMDPDVQVGLGVLLNLSNEYEKAMDCFRAALAIQPDDYRLWNKVGATLQKAGDSAGAVEMYANALERNPLYIRARYNLAIGFMNLGQYSDAVEHLLTCLELQKTTVDVPSDTNESIWNSLRLLMFMMNMDFLAQECINQNLEAFREYFEF